MNEPDKPTENGNAPEPGGAAGGMGSWLFVGGALVALLAGVYFFSGSKPGGAAATVDWGEPAPRSALESNEAAVLSHIRQLAFCADQYAGANPRWGFPAAVEQMGATGTNCLDAAAAKAVVDAEELFGYRVSYQPWGNADDGQMTEFVIEARPARFGKSGIRSFYLDRPDIYMTHFTANDRPATENDPLVY